jgi:hypothetical protein
VKNTDIWNESINIALSAQQRIDKNNMNIVIPVIFLFLFVAFLISVNNDLKEKKVVREIILNEEKIEKICFLESLISSRMVREYEKDKILA